MDKQLIINLANFNKLFLTDEETLQMEEYLEFALASLAKMNEVDCEDVLPLIHCVDLTNVFRQDIAAKTVSREEVLANAPQQSERCFQVPRVVE